MEYEASKTPQSLIKQLQDRAAYRGDLGEEIDSFQKRLQLAKAVLDADGYSDVQTMYQILKEAIVQEKPDCADFAKAFITHITGGGKPEEFFTLKKNEQYQDLNIDTLVTSVVQESLEVLPLPGLLDMITSGVINEDLPLIQSDDSKLIEASPVPPVSVYESRVVEEKEAKYPVVEALFRTNDLWVSHRPEGSTIEERFTTLDNIAVLLTGDGWDEGKLQTAKIALQQTVIKNYKNDTEREFTGVFLSDEGYGNRRFYSENQVKGLITFMRDFLPTSKSPHQFTSEEVTRWPFDISKKKRT
jgi:hypothetical protein